MNKNKRTLIALLLITLLVTLLIGYGLFAVPGVSSGAGVSQSEDAITRGAYLVSAGGCYSCHRGEENSESLSGGLGLETQFGTFYAPNITPDRETGIGNWTAEDFLLALKHGRTPSGNFYYPAFPYRAYAGLSDEEVLDIASYLMSLQAVSNQVADAETASWLFRWMIAIWNIMADFADPAMEQFSDEAIARGAYLANNLGHCSECHTPRNSLGIFDFSRAYGGATLGEENIEAIDAEALANWTSNNFALFLLIGLKPDGEFVGGDMNDVIEHNTSKLTDEDRKALAAYFTRSSEAYR